MTDLTQEFLHSIFEYKDGVLYNKVDRLTSKKGCAAGYLRKNGYEQIKISGKAYLTHRLIYIMFFGTAPDFIDHKDGNRNNNKIENLREATRSQNGLNSCVPKNNTSGSKNVYWKKQFCKYQVVLTVNKKLRSFGYYKDFDLAELVAIEAREKYCKEFARHK